MLDTAYSNKRRQKNNLPLLSTLYTQNEVTESLNLFKTIGYDQEYAISPRIKFRFTDADRLVGSAAVHLSILEDDKYTHLTFSGDVGRYGDILVKSPCRAHRQ